jgi:Ca-activated chloride channel family protein
MIWQDPHLLALIALALALGALRWWWQRALVQAQRGIGTATPRLIASHGRRRARLRQALLWSGLVVGLAALAGPRWGTSERTEESRGADLYIAIDASRSMLATDSHPTRLATAKRKALSLMDSAPEHRVALLPFAGTAVLMTPLTGDRDAVAELLQEVDPDLFPAEHGRQGTAIGDTFQQALQLIGETGATGAAIVIFSDGADPDSDAVAAAAADADAAGVPIYTVFFGDPSRETTVMIDGREVVMAADRSTLDLLPERTGGISVNATPGQKDVQAIADHIAGHLELKPWEEQRREVATQRYQWLLGPALLMLLTALLLPTLRRRRSA